MNLSKREKQDLIDLIILNCEEQDTLMVRVGKLNKGDQKQVIELLKQKEDRPILDRPILDFVESMEKLHETYGIAASSTSQRWENNRMFWT